MENKQIHEMTNEEILRQQLELPAERSQSNLMKIKITINISELDDLETILKKVSNVHQALIPTHGSDRAFEIDIIVD